jgi:hypothetical protein
LGRQLHRAFINPTVSGVTRLGEQIVSIIIGPGYKWPVKRGKSDFGVRTALILYFRNDSRAKKFRPYLPVGMGLRLEIFTDRVGQARKPVKLTQQKILKSLICGI